MKWLIAKLMGNLGKVDNGVWRSAQRWHLYPIWLCLGLKTIINVATDPDDPHDSFEKKFCGWLKIQYVAFDNLGPIYNFEKAFKALVGCEKPVLVHCEGGRDRTGGLMATYKRKKMNRTLEDIVGDWTIHGVPHEAWLMFLFKRL